MDQTSKTSPKRWVRVIFVMSLALNLLVVGLVAGAFFGNGGKHPGRSVELGLGPYTRALDVDVRRALVERLRKTPELGRRVRNARRSDFRQMLVALRQEPFDQEAVLAIMEKQRAHTLTVQTAGQSALVDALVSMSPEQRAAFADRLENEIKRGPRSRRSDNANTSGG